MNYTDMDSSGDEETDSFLKNLSQPLPDPRTFLRKNGIHFESVEKDDNNLKIQIPPKQHIHEDDMLTSSLDDLVQIKLNAFQKQLFGDVSREELKKKEKQFEAFGISNSQVELLEKLSEAAAKDLSVEQPGTSFQHVKHTRSFTDQYNISLPAWTPFKSNIEESTYIDGLKLLNKTLNQFIPEISETPIEQNQEKKVIGRTVEEIAKIIADPSTSTRTTKCKSAQECNENSKISTPDQAECSKDDKKKLATDSKNEENIEIKTNKLPDDKNVKKEKVKKKKKKDEEDEYVPKLIPINWSDPRSDTEFMKELEDIMNCDGYAFNPSGSSLPAELDNMSETLPSLPRDIIKMLSATDEQLADWEYSIKVEKGEATDDEDESYTEEMEKELKRIKYSEKFLQLKKQTLEEKEQPVITGSVDVSEFLRVVAPPCADEIVAERDGEGNIITYVSVPRSEEHITKEFERLHLGLESDSEDEDAEDDPVDKMYEIDWDKDKTKIKNNNVIGDLEGTITDFELNDHVKIIDDYIEKVKSENASGIDPIEKNVDTMNQMLDDLGFPKQREIKEDTLEEYLEAELQKYDFLFKANKGKICPPGNLISEVKQGDADFNFAIEEESLKPEGQTIKRPSHLGIKLPEGSDSEEELPTSEIVSTKVQDLDEETENLFKETESSILLEGLPDFTAEEVFNNTKPSISTENKKTLTDKEEEELDNKFIKEYFSRGGTKEGLGKKYVPDLSLNLETLESYSKKFLTYPYISEHSGAVDLVRIRRTLATSYPEFSNEIFSDLSKVSDLSKDFHAPESDSSSDSDSSDDIRLSFKAEPITTEDIMEKSKLKLCDDYGSNANKSENLDHDGTVTPSAESVTKICEPEPTCHLKHKGKKHGRLSKMSESSSLSDENSENTDEIKSIYAEWSPFETKPIPSEEGAIKHLSMLHEILLPKQRKFKVPRKMKDWIKGKYEPSRDDIRKWRQHYFDYFDDMPSILNRVINSDEMQKCEEIITAVEKDNSQERKNLILTFKKLFEEQNTDNNEEENLITSVPDEIDGGNNSSQPSENTFQENSVEMSVLPHEEGKDVVAKNAFEVEKTEEVVEIMKRNLKVDDGELQTGSEGNSTKKAQEETETPKPPKIPVLRLRDVPRPLRKEEWAEEVNSNAKIELMGTPAMSYPFELDGFQKHAIQALEDGYNVFVSAHTSAGKTVVAEYAIAMSKRNRSKAVYTSPVKALSNQKYADFKRIFGSVGLITGDIQLNENAECLIMTTEILRSMLYNTSEKIRDLEFVVFDEVHYINDPERGHVWEEVLILLPPQVQIVMLSATVPNTLEFANWVGRTKQRKVMVCATHHRPVPLQHYIYTGTGGPSPGETYLVKNGDGPFLVGQYGKAEAAMKAAQEKERKNRKKQLLKRAEEEKEWKRGGMSKPKPMSHPSDSQDKRDQTLWISVVSFLQNKDWLPAVVFVFSRKKCDVFADRLRTIDLTTKSEKSFIHRFIKSQVEKLDEVDQDLPQIKIMQSQLLQGIGVHHSGILPIMKEIVEVLFQEGKVKLLFATETFAMGVNMPARTVLFHSIKKFDGNGIRLLYPAEYIQMAGRAGRRGKDSAGNVIILAKPAELIARHDLETLMFGNPSKLISKFRLSYRMILNTLTMSGMLTVQSMMASSYCENQGQLKKKFVEKDLIEAEQFERTLKKKVINDVSDLDVDLMAKFYTNAHAFINKWKEGRLQMICHSKILKDLQPGKLLKICSGKYINRTALLLEVAAHKDPLIRFTYRVMLLDQDIQYTRDITSVGMEMGQEQLEEWYRLVSLMHNLPPEKEILSGPNEYIELVIKPQEIVAVYKESLKLQKNQIQEYLLQHNNRPGFRNKISEAGDKIARQMWASIGKTTEINEINNSFENYELCLKIADMWKFYEDLTKSPIRYNPLVLNSFKKVFRWKQAEEKVKTLRMCLSDENMILYPDFKNKKALLKEKEYIDDSDSVQIKGYMAARVGKYELVVCELLVENILVNMEPEEVAALLSFLVCRSNNSDHYPNSFKTLTPSLQEGIKKCQKIIRDVILLEKQFQIEDYEGSETTKLSFGLVPIMYAWVKQEPFKKIMEMDELKEFEFQEGLLVRWIQQLLETLKEVEAAARVMGDPGVPTKLQAAGQRIKRGIVFAPSLYTTML